jgi:hypothetical protein
MEKSTKFAPTINTDIDQKTQRDDDIKINSGLSVLLHQIKTKSEERYQTIMKAGKFQLVFAVHSDYYSN